MLDGRDRSTEWWQKAVVVPVRRAWVVVAARLRRKKHGKFHHYLDGQPAVRPCSSSTSLQACSVDSLYHLII
jgi:hypothetical protein